MFNVAFWSFLGGNDVELRRKSIRVGKVYTYTLKDLTKARGMY